MTESTVTRLRKYAANLRTKPIPLAEVIPLLQTAADEIESLQYIIEDLKLQRIEMAERIDNET